MIDDFVIHIHSRIIPAALDLLPSKMDTPEARAEILAIGLQESRFKARRQLPNGPANGFWQFERGGGVTGVLTHPDTKPLLLPILKTLRYPADVAACYEAIRHNDVLAVIFARLLLWTVPGSLAKSTETVKGWTQYLNAWRPGKPHVATWSDCFNAAWDVVENERA